MLILFIPFVFSLIFQTNNDPQISSLLYTCTEMARATNLGISGEYILKLKTNNNGKIFTITKISDSVNSKVLERCLRHGLLTLTLPIKNKAFKIKLKVPKIRKQHAIWLNNIPIIRTIAKDVFVRPLIYKENTGLNTYPIAIIKIANTGNLPAHFHLSSDVFLIVLDGKIKLSWEVNKTIKSKELSKNKLVFIPKKTPHQIQPVKDSIIGLFYTNSNDFKWLQGKPSTQTRILPPPSIPLTGPKPDLKTGKKLVIKTIPIKNTVKNIRKTLVLRKNSYSITLLQVPKNTGFLLKGKFSGFVLSGAGEIKGSNNIEILRGGTGIASTKVLYFVPVKEKHDFNAIIIHQKGLKIQKLSNKYRLGGN